MNLRPLIAALVALTFTSCGSPVAELGDPSDSAASIDDLKAARAPAAWKIRVAKTSTSPSFKSRFVIATTPDLFAALDIPTALAGQHVAAFEWISPEGVVFQRSEVPFSMGSAKTYRVWNAMPVSGTWIQQFAMTGSWSVRVFLDSEANSRATAAFVLQ